ncbi:MAG: hypothetical protein FWB80_06180 [Defluviitaleaceae bacterium]|nr:hypothetical protein [Defluviitaleaceae bacterium]
MIVVANTRKTVVRISDTATAINWEVVKQHFPIGEKMNENTHVFDGSIFNKNGQTRLFLAALPVYVCDELAKEGAEKAGSIHKVKRIETAEHLMFRKYCDQAINGEVYIFLPQDEGIRILHIRDSLPNATHYMSNHPTHREAEFNRFYSEYKTDDEKQAILPHDDTMDWLHAILDKEGFRITTAPRISP